MLPRLVPHSTKRGGSSRSAGATSATSRKVVQRDFSTVGLLRRRLRAVRVRSREVRRGTRVMLAALTLILPGCRAETASCPLVRQPDAVIFDLRSALPNGQPAMVQICADGKCVGHAVAANQPASTKILSIFTRRKNSDSFTAAASASRKGTTLFSNSVTARLKQTFPFGQQCGGVWRVTIVADREGHLTTTDTAPLPG